MPRTAPPLVGYHAFAAENLGAVLEEGLHLGKTRAWGSGLLDAGEGVYLASTPRSALRLGEPGGLAICRVERDAAMADEDEVPRALFDAVIRIGPAFGVVPFKDEDVGGGWSTTFAGADLAAALRAGAADLTVALAAEVGRILARRSSARASPDLCQRLVEGWLAAEALTRPYGGTLGASLFDVPREAPALRAYKALEHEVCARHRDLGRNRKAFCFRSTVALGHEGPSSILAVLSSRDGTWRIERGEIPDALLPDLAALGEIEPDAPGPVPR